MRSLVVGLAAFIGLTAQSSAQQLGCTGPTAHIFADTISFSLDSIPDWAFDCKAGKADELLIVLHYRGGGTRSVGGAIMYASVLRPTPGESDSFDDRVASDIANRRRGAPDLVVTALGTIRTKSGEAAKVRRFVNPRTEVYELIAYVPRGPIIPVIGLRARSKISFEAAVRYFDRLVESYTSAGAGQRQ